MCNLASLNLKKYVTLEGNVPTFLFDLLEKDAAQLVKNLDNIIDVNYYPTPECKRSNME